MSHRSGKSSRLAAPAALIGALALAGAGCGSEEPSGAAAGQAPAPAERAAPAEPAKPAAAAVDHAAEAEELFAMRCTTCHGATGAGDGPGSAALDPKPRNFQSAEWQQSVTDEQIKNTILYGGAATGKSPAMPGNPDLVAQEQLVAALVEHIRSFKR